jgi:formylmethanofuran dehydrogenase subunit E
MQSGTSVTFQEVVAFHGHSCPGLAIGYRAAAAGLRELGVERPKDEELVAIVENDACGIDAVQVVAGTTLGKGNLIFRDYGKRAYSFINRKTGDAVRIAERPEFSEMKGDPEIARLRRKVVDGTATDAEKRDFSRLSLAYVKDLLAMPEEEMFSITRVTVEVPEQARIFRSVRCSICGETLSESRARVREGRIVCIPCSEPYGRGWG